MKFSISIEYAVHALIFMAGNSSKNATQIATVAKAIAVPEPYLRKIFQQLTHAGILSSKRGARGGFHLIQEPAKISLKDVVEAIDGSLPVYECLRDQRNCAVTSACHVRATFERAKQKMADVLDATSVKDLRDNLVSHRQEAAWLKVSA